MLDCVADTIYHEARGEGETGMRAVAHVIFNRAKERNASSPCVIVYEPNQFKYSGRITNTRLWNLAKSIAQNPGPDITSGATYFHNTSVRPSWSYRFTLTFRFGNHLFYRR